MVENVDVCRNVPSPDFEISDTMTLFAQTPPTVPVAVQELASRIPLFVGVADLRIAPLAGVISLNNTNYRVEAGGEACLLRVGADTAHFLGINRDDEIEVARAAAKTGVGPQVLYAEPTGVLVLSFLEGKHWKAEAFHEPCNIIRIAEILRRLHAIKTVTADGSQYRRIERLLKSALAMNLELPPEIETYREKLGRIERERLSDPRYTPGLAHNDFCMQNFLDDGQNLCLLDWEFSGTGDTLIDLATISMGNGYSEEEQIALLNAYGLTGKGDLATLQTMKWVASFFEAAWALVMHGIRGSATSGVEDGFSYENYARAMFKGLSDR